MKRWSLEDAQERLAEIIQQAATDGPQEIALGHTSAVLISREDYARLTMSGLVTFLRNSPLAELPSDIERDKSPIRGVDL